jgi:ABC-type glycerol-3-phosphate transport system substrate-binding protein
MKLRPFELAMVIIFGAMFTIALVLLSTFEPGPEEGEVNLGGAIAIWGTLPANVMDDVLRDISDSNEGFDTVSYRYIRPEKFDDEFISALADQNPPDLLFVSHERLVKHRSRLFPVSYEMFPERDFRTIYIDGAAIFALNDGLYGYPIAVDPLVMYWNRSMFSTNGFLLAPTSWEEIVADIVPSLTERDFNRNIQRSAIAMGEYSNIKNSFPVISTLLMQGGSALVSEKDKSYKIQLNETISNSSTRPFTSTVTFFTNFSNVNNSLYSWNRTLGLDRDMFLREELALYFGYGSEGRDIETKNPNLSFDVAEVPQGESATIKRTYGKFYGFLIPKASKNKSGSFTVMSTLGSVEIAKSIADGYNFAPVHRDSLQVGSNDVYGRIIYQSAFNARGWLNPDREKTDEVFTLMLEDVSSNRKDVKPAINDATARLQQVY